MKTAKIKITPLMILSLFLLGSVLLSLLLGYRFFNVETPSMGQTAPVGTLIITKAQPEYKKDDIVTFYSSGSIYTHRIVGAPNSENFTTKGDLNTANDALPLNKANIIGKAVAIIPIAGWILKALPMFLIGITIVFVISILPKIKDRRRWPIRLLGGSIVVMVITFILNPWLRVNLITVNPIRDGVDLFVVNTGIFPIKDDSGNRIYPGQTTTVFTNDIDSDGRFIYIPRPSLGFWGVIFALLWCLIPLFIALMVKLPPPEKELPPSELEKEKRVNATILAVFVSLAIIILLIQLSSLAAFTATVKNSSNKTVTGRFFNCQKINSPQANNGLNPLFSWPLNDSRDTLKDISGNNNRGISVPSYRSNNSNVVAYPAVNPSIISGSAGGCRFDSNSFARFDASQRICISNSTNGRLAVSNPSPNFSISLWFRTTEKNVYIIGFARYPSDPADNGDVSRDRNIYIDSNGRIVFGLFGNRRTTVLASDNKNYADGQWHHVVATLSSSSGAALYIDGARKATNATSTSGESGSGYWRLGCGSLNWWPDADRPRPQHFSSSNYYSGDIQFVSLYNTAMTPQQVLQYYQAGKSD